MTLNKPRQNTCCVQFLEVEMVDLYKKCSFGMTNNIYFKQICIFFKMSNE